MGKSSSRLFREEVLRSHNEHRRKHQAPPLKLSSKLSRDAAGYAESLSSTRILKHSAESSRGNCGENLAWASYDQTGEDVSDRWYNEVNQYNFNRPGFSSATGRSESVCVPRVPPSGPESSGLGQAPRDPEWEKLICHFTAMVWKSSEKLGVGKAVASDGSTFVVARYFPAGNVTNHGQFQANVLPPKS